jgi:phosphoserine aminotransferase
MPSRSEITYFGAGPAALPTDVLQEAAQALLDYQGTGLGIAEHSHRSQYATDIVNATRADLAAYLSIPTEKYEVLFMQAGGTGEFSATLYNLVGAWVARERARVVEDETAKPGEESDEVVGKLREAVKEKLKVDYIVTGSWSLKAYQEALRLLGPEHVHLVVDARKAAGAEGTFGAIPPESEWKLSEGAAMVYYCDNETVDGVEFPAFPKALEPRADGSGPVVVADMSSNILSRRVPVENYGVFFFGAQKNLGSTGVTVAAVRKDLVMQPSPILMRKLGLPIAPAILVYEYIAKNNSLYNTLSIFE